MLAVLDQKFAIDLNHLVPMTMVFIESNEYSVGSGQALIVDVAGVAARAINANIDLLGLVETMRASVANGKAYCNVDGLCSKIFG